MPQLSSVRSLKTKTNDLKLCDYVVDLLEKLFKCIKGFDIDLQKRLPPWLKELPSELRKQKTEEENA